MQYLVDRFITEEVCEIYRFVEADTPEEAIERVERGDYSPDHVETLSVDEVAHSVWKLTPDGDELVLSKEV